MHEPNSRAKQTKVYEKVEKLLKAEHKKDIVKEDLNGIIYKNVLARMSIIF